MQINSIAQKPLQPLLTDPVGTQMLPAPCLRKYTRAWTRLNCQIHRVG